jgi:hypothetical protein|tara:strand:- start:91 stop:465 length:375 start_codon:yes stop_codon:yes gene_type:complete
MEQTNVVQMPEQKEFEPWERNPDLNDVEVQLANLEERLKRQMSITKNQADTIERYRKDLNAHINTWNSVFTMMQISNPEIVTSDNLDDAVSDCISNNSDVVSQDNLEEKVNDAISDLNFSVTVE